MEDNTGAAATVAPVAGIRPPQPLCIDNNLADNWRSFEQKWKNSKKLT